MFRYFLIPLAIVQAVSASSIVQGVVYLPSYITGGSHPTHVQANGTDSGGTFENAYTSGGSVNVNIATGTMKGEAHGNNTSAGLRMEIREEFRIFGAPTTTPIPVKFEFEVEGTGDVNPLMSGIGISTMTAWLYTKVRDVDPFLPDAKYIYLWSLDQQGIGATETWVHESQGTVQVNNEAKGEFDVVLHSTDYLTVQENGLSRIVDLVFFIEGSAGGNQGGGALDLLNTGRVSVILPPGYTAISTSGVFLTEADPGSPVPEPSTYAFAVFGILAAYSVKKRAIHRPR